MEYQKFDLELPAYYDYEAILPLEYFEVKLASSPEWLWYVFYIDEQGRETEYGPYQEQELLERIQLAPFYFEEVVFIYYLVESIQDPLRNLGIHLLKSIAKL